MENKEEKEEKLILTWKVSASTKIKKNTYQNLKEYLCKINDENLNESKKILDNGN
jgi:hypothetical protein